MSPMLFYGIIAAGGVYSPANLSATVSDLTRQIRQGESRLIVCSHDTRGVAVAAARTCGLPMCRVLVLQSQPVPKLTMLENGEKVISEQELDWERITDQEELESTLVCLLYSSGTSGLPKGIFLRDLEVATLITVHRCPYLASKSRRADLPLRGKRPWASANARRPMPKDGVQDHRQPAYCAHRRSRILLLVSDF